MALLAGCAASPRPQPAATTAARPPPAIDGRYRGTARLVRSEHRLCPRSGPRVYEVQNGAVELAYSALASAHARPDRVTLRAPIGPDGHFQANDGAGTLEGQLREGLLEITVASEICEHRWTLRKVP